jgi:hypothetical protein
MYFCVLCLIVSPLPWGRNSFTYQLIIIKNIIIIKTILFLAAARNWNKLILFCFTICLEKPIVADTAAYSSVKFYQISGEIYHIQQHGTKAI